MNKSCIGTLCSSLLICATSVSATETTIELDNSGQSFVGTLSMPEGAPAPVALLLHGFTGARDELKSDPVPAGVFAHTAAKLKEAGYASLRIDFRGSGESLADLTFADTTFEGQISDAIAAINYLKNSDAVQGDAIHLIGWSQGGLVAASAAGRGADVASLSLWNAVGDPMATYGGLMGTDVVAAAIAGSADASVDVTLPWGAELTLKGAFFDGVGSHDPIAEIAGYNGPLFVASGLQDGTVLPGLGDAYIAAHEGVETLWKADMDHVFNAFGTVETLDQMIDQTIGFLEESS